jgi:hypothetical protein
MGSRESIQVHKGGNCNEVKGVMDMYGYIRGQFLLFDEQYIREILYLIIEEFQYTRVEARRKNVLVVYAVQFFYRVGALEITPRRLYSGCEFLSV